MLNRGRFATGRAARSIAGLWAVASLGLAAPSAGSAAEPVALATPVGVTVTAVARPLRVDGALTALYAVTSSLPPTEVARRYAEFWALEAEYRHVTDERVGAWRVLGRRVGPLHETLQLRGTSAGGSAGWLARRPDVTTIPQQPALPLSLPPQAQVLRTVESAAAGRRAVQVVAIATQPPAALLATLRFAATRSGWQPVDPAASGPASRPRALRFTRANEELWLAVVPHSRAAGFVLHHVRDDPPQVLP
ncbi:MAG: hypothetical protein O9284_18230 [Steroidobacteraceae bacterium]|jgi:hypothetical protein|nr:hypothetical protein [Steroidobacteraceae bacterium]